jgi:hypothetical protein
MVSLRVSHRNSLGVPLARNRSVRQQSQISRSTGSRVCRIRLATALGASDTSLSNETIEADASLQSPHIHGRGNNIIVIAEKHDAYPMYPL